VANENQQPVKQSMIKELRLENFRGFDDHCIPFNPRTTVVVGKNNAGKSTIVEALRLVSLITNRYQRLEFRSLPIWLDRPRRERGVSPSIKNIELNLDSAFHRYNDPPAIITCTFERGESITIYIGEQSEIYGVIRDSQGNLVVTPTQAHKFELPNVQILPQIAPLEESEKILDEGYVKRHIVTSRSSLHFRNQLKVLYEYFQKFKKIAEATWPGLRITSLEGRGSLPGQELSLLVQDTDFVAEVGWMGHGLQMWLQTMWFLTYSEGADVVILDEPDVYMHADLQRRLIRFVKNRDWQTIIATHSMEMMAEVEPEEVLVVDRRKDKSTFAPSLPAVQKVVNYIGSIHNIQLARLWSAKTLLLVEGDDVTILKRFQNRLFPTSEKPFDALPNMSIGGWGGWRLVSGSSFFLKNAGGEDILTYCFLDSDYHHDEQVAARYAEAKTHGVELHIWSRKEIENFLIVPSAIQRVIAFGCKANKTPPTVEDVENEINSIAEGLRDEIFDNLCTEFATNKALAAGTANKRARERLTQAWSAFEGRISIVPGKQMVSALSSWSQKNFSASFNATKLASSLQKTEINLEIQAVVEAIENHESFPPSLCR
jgi:energy-coupling factor transporter ATP-binding protein EcfA2